MHNYIDIFPPFASSTLKECEEREREGKVVSYICHATTNGAQNQPREKTKRDEIDKLHWQMKIEDIALNHWK